MFLHLGLSYGCLFVRLIMPFWQEHEMSDVWSAVGRHMVLVCQIIDDINLDYLVKMVSTGFLHSNLCN